MNLVKYATLKPIVIIVCAYAVAMSLTCFLAIWANSPYSLWFKDTPIILLAALVYIVFLGIVWDGSLILIGLICEKWHGRQSTEKFALITVETSRKLRFFTCGPAPLILILLTAFVVLGTSNITLISLKLLGNVTHWRDPYLWEVEGAAIMWLTQLPINVAAWDGLYHSAWGIEMFAAFVLILVGRGPKIVLYFCMSLILLFYLGRFLGLVNPVMGPAFFHPEYYGYLGGSVTDKAMQLVSSVMSQAPESAIDRGGILLGGVSAMPSLHVAMVAVTSYWLAIAKRWTLVVTVPWILLVWASTVVLGWHYMLDGAGGIMLGAACIWATRMLLARVAKEAIA